MPTAVGSLDLGVCAFLDLLGLVEQHRKGLVFHDHKGSRVAVHHHASNLHKLAEALELSWKTKRHGADLHKALHAHLRHRIRVLERVHALGFGFV